MARGITNWDCQWKNSKPEDPVSYCAAQASTRILELESRCAVYPHRGFESHPLRQFLGTQHDRAAGFCKPAAKPSALGPKADSRTSNLNVPFVPETDPSVGTQRHPMAWRGKAAGVHVEGRSNRTCQSTLLQNRRGAGLLNPTKLFLKAEAVIVIALVDDLAVLDLHESYPVEAE
jgi:hypothetical protein